MPRFFSLCRTVGLLAALALALGTVAVDLAPGGQPATAGEAVAADAFGYGFTAIEGHDLPLEQYRGRPLLVVNTASFCGFTRQYADLQRLWERYRDAGLVVLGVPSDDFNQEMDDNAAIQEFCETTFGIDFPLTERVGVHGPASHPLFDHIRAKLGAAAGPGWNFYKYLIAPDGRVVAFWPSRVAPLAPEVTAAIEAALGEAS